MQMKNFNKNLPLITTLFLAAGLFLFSPAGGWADEVLIDNFDDSARSPNANALGGVTGSFINEDRDTGEQFAFCIDRLRDGGMEIEFSRDARPESFCGFFSLMGPEETPDETIDLTTTDVNQISFKVRGESVDGVPGGGHNFQIEIKDGAERRLMTTLANVPGFEAGTVEGELRQVDIPFSAMRSDGGPIDLTSVKVIAIVFNQEFTDPNAQAATSKIFIDDLKFTHRENPPPSILESDPANPDIDLIARATVIGAGPSNAQVITIAEDGASLRGTALKFYHNLTDSGDFFAFFSFPPESPVDLISEGIRTVKIRMRKTGFDNAPSKVVIELKESGTVRGTVLTYNVGAGTEGTDYAETIFPIYSESPTIDEVVIVFFDGGDGAFMVDEIAFSADPYVPNNPAYSPSTGPARSDDELLDYIQSQSARYFVNQLVGNSLHARDRSSAESASSIAATAFEISALTVISERYDPNPESLWHITSSDGTEITPDEARERAGRILDEFLNIQSSQPDLETGEGDLNREFGIAGFFYHFLDENGKRSGDSEVSVIDTAIFLSSAIQAGEYFGGDIRAKAEALLQNINWDFVFYDPDKAFRLSWLPELKRGFTVGDPAGIGYLSDSTIGRPTDELLLVNFLALASNPANISYQQALYSYPRVERTYHSISGGDFHVVNSFFGSAFTYLYAHLFYDFALLGPDRPDLIGEELRYPTSVNWWTNSVSAMKANRQFSIDRGPFFPFSYHELSWGISPVERPDGRYEGLYGGVPAENGPTHDGTVAPHIAFSALPFFRTSPGESLSSNQAFQTMRFGYDHLFNDLFGAYGPVDSFNDKAEFADIFLGLDQGPIVLAIENYRSGLIWNTFMQNARMRAVFDIGFGHVPQFDSVNPQTITAGSELAFTLTATDRDGDSGIEISSDSLPDGAMLTNEGSGQAVFKWTPDLSDAGLRIVGFTVRDVFRENPDPLFVNITVELPPNPEPFAFIASPVSGASLTGIISIEAATSDPENTALGILYLDGRRLSRTAGETIHYQLQTAFFQNGDHAIKARFYHQPTQAYLDVEKTFTFQNSEILQPQFRILQPLEGAVLSGNMEVTMEASDPAQTFRSMLYVDQKLARVELRELGPFTVDTAKFANGVHTIRLRAYNRYFRLFMEDEIQVQFNNPLPPFFISSPLQGAAVSSVITVDVTDQAEDQMVFARLYIDGRFWRFDFFSPFRFYLDTRQLSDGPHRLTVKAFSRRLRSFLKHEITVNVANS